MDTSYDLEAAARQLQTDGWCVVPNALLADELAQARAALDAAVAEMQALGVSTHTETLDPNDANIRVYNLPDFDPIFIELLRHPAALALTEAVLGAGYIVSNFTANIALPGSQSMRLHSDQALVIPPPWRQPWAMNIIWCLDDVREENGSTRYLPGSHLYETPDDLPEDAMARTRAFTAPAGSFVAMEGRLWHTSGANQTADERRAMLFGYYAVDFLRQQVNWDVTLSPETKDRLDPGARALLGMGPSANTRISGGLVRLDPEVKTRPNIRPRAESVRP